MQLRRWVLMGMEDLAVSGEAARTLVQFLHGADDRYVLKFPARIGALPHYRPAEYGGFKMKSVIGPDARVEEDHVTDEEMVDRITSAVAIEVVPASETVPEAWGTTTIGHDPLVSREVLKAQQSLVRASEYADRGWVEQCAEGLAKQAGDLREAIHEAERGDGKGSGVDG